MNLDKVMRSLNSRLRRKRGLGIRSLPDNPNGA
jgi:hypothetical protein